ncbi:putative HTH-type transcriptional regulator YdfH [Gimesia maris]|jgi:DNA-binding GntR family transcriptional regulator|uniref:GntR family transcriptional regulator n=1 Tax=Gimesia maris TaxID=122 RepID=A0A3D3R8T3_9PLAN|nr:GntR family transcriptional regulator [Gimesia maris]MAC53496.1 exonuclease [Gimesia sp.]QDT78013.1 putative HTH-type transcriptional regulator YdfH [Gimesia maris]QDU13671.1 putative HTH-type transcriptional regulator YdfH [Gimesia maris]HCO25271.1 GntR family transcriptional regulator [Gimesia maris]|tara:strand:+ start:93116 stop:93736 length:621 start_codon:yes stop_codon:yes gene_type:complete
MNEPQLVRGLGEQIVERLREDILSGRIAEGERLREVDLAKRFSVSRGPIREAIQQLAWEGVVETDRNKGALVSTSAPNEITELIIPLRCTIEKYAIRLYFDQLTEDDFLVWETILNKMKQACEVNDFALISEHDIAFHRSLVTRAHSPDLLAIWSAMVSRIRRHFRESHLKYQQPIQIYEEHLPIIEALREGSLTEVLQTIEDHIE